MKNISILGSTGSIGGSTLDVIAMFPESFSVSALSACENIEKLETQIRGFKPALVSLNSGQAARVLNDRCSDLDVEIVSGVEGLIQVSTIPEADIVVSAVSGSAGLIPTLSAIKAGKTVALANKETMVMAGEIVTREAEKKGVRILPVDSEHSAIFQVMECGRREDLHKIILTASGGPFLNKSYENRKRVTVEDSFWPRNRILGAILSIVSATL